MNADVITPPRPGSPAGASRGSRVKASPAARRIAEENGLDLASVEGSGPGGRVVKADVERALGSGSAPAAASPLSAPHTPASSPTREPEPAKGAVEVIELTSQQREVAARMAESKATVPHFQLEAEIDVTRALAARARLETGAAGGSVVPSLADLIVKATALALRDFPHANGAYRDGRWELYERVNVGISVAAEGSLAVPTIFDADAKGLTEIALETRELVRRVREGALTDTEVSGATFTVADLGMLGVANFSPVINPPQAAMLGVGAVSAKPRFRDRELVPAEVMSVTLACDHRILNGADGAAFLARVKALLEEPLGLAL